MPRPWTATLLVSLALGSSGCLELLRKDVGYTTLMDQVACPLPPVDGARVKVVTASPAAPHEEKGLIEASGIGSDPAATEVAINKARSEAARRGCHLLRLNGVTIDPGTEVRDLDDALGDVLTGFVFTDFDHKIVTATCIALTDPGCEDRPPPPRPREVLPASAFVPPPAPPPGFIDAAPHRRR